MRLEVSKVGRPRRADAGAEQAGRRRGWTAQWPWPLIWTRGPEANKYLSGARKEGKFYCSRTLESEMSAIDSNSLWPKPSSVQLLGHSGANILRWDLGALFSCRQFESTVGLGREGRVLLTGMFHLSSGVLLSWEPWVMRLKTHDRCGACKSKHRPGKRWKKRCGSTDLPFLSVYQEMMPHQWHLASSAIYFFQTCIVINYKSRGNILIF